MYIVKWDNHEGNRQQRAFDDLEDATAEAAALKEKFDYVQVRGESER